MELVRALAVLVEPPAAEHALVARTLDLPVPTAREHTDLFLFQLYPYASVYAGAEGMLGGEAGDRVAGFWRALGLTPPAEPDHLAALLGLYAMLGDRDAPTEWRRALLWEHLLSWLPVFLAKLDEVAPPSYRAWGRLLADVLAAEAEKLGPQALLPLHLRSAPPLEPPNETGGEAFLSGLLAPVRSGIVLVRDDLRRAAAELELGLRVAERRFVLRALLAQDAAGTLAWLASEARRWAGLHTRALGRSDEIASFWHARAEAAAALLDETTSAAAKEVVHA